MPSVVFLCGPPGCGKSTLRESIFKDWLVLSTDDEIKRLASNNGQSYDEAFKELFPIAQKQFDHNLNLWQKENCNFVIDRTNLTKATRQRLLDKINPRYKKIAVYFPEYPPHMLKATIDKRSGQSIPSDIVKSMSDAYQMPKENEGFDLVISSSFLPKVLGVMSWTTKVI
jgi:predicted kinase